jgi:argininosuccinate lyase
VPFREAHEVAGDLVRHCELHTKELTDLADAELAAVDPRLTPAVRAVLDVPGALRARSAHGGTAPDRVAEQLASLEETLQAHRAWSGEPVVPMRESR